MAPPNAVEVLADMLARGVTGVVDMAWGDDPEDWPRRLAAIGARGALPGVLPRIRTAVYRDKLERWIAAGLRTGEALPGSLVGGDGAETLEPPLVKLTTQVIVRAAPS